jgi:lipopolysaccharide heptosyltransferase I
VSRDSGPTIPLAPPGRILIIKPSAIGDIVHALPVLNLMRRRWPEAHITWMVTAACAGMVESHPQINEVIRFDRTGSASAWRSPAAAVRLARFMRELRERRFDLVVDLQGLFRSGWFAGQTKAPRRVGFANAREMGWLFYTARVISSWEDHAVERYLCMAEALGLGKEPVEFHFAVSDADRAAVATMLPEAAPYAVLLPGANWETKRWPVERFAALVNPIRQRFGLQSIIAGGSADRALAAQIPGALDLTGKTNLHQLVALLERAALVIGADTGPTHIAAALNKPLVTMHGPTDAVLTGPYGRNDGVIRLDIPCSPCFSRKCAHQSCLKWLAIEPVLELAHAQLSPNVAGRSATSAR